MNSLRVGSSALLWYTFLAIVIFLVVTNWQGFNAILGTAFRGYAGGVTALQGRDPSKVFGPPPRQK